MEAMSQIAESACGEIGISFEKITSALKSPVAAGAAGAAAIAGVGVAAVNTAVDIDSAMNQLQASTGLAAEETENYRQVMEGVYKNNYGESFGEIADVIGKIRQQVGGVVDSWEPEALQGMVESAFALQDISGGALDVESSVRAASTMMEQFGIGGDEALSMIAAGYQDLGPDAVTALADIEDGMYDAADAMEEIKDVKYDDLGSQFETLKRNVEMLLVPLGESLIPLLSDLMEEVLPPLMEALEPLLEILTALLEPLLSMVGEILQPLLEILMELLDPFIELISECIEPLLGLIEQLLDPLLELIESCIKPLLELVLELIEPLLQVLSECLEPLIGVFTELFDPIFNLIESALKPLLEILQPIVEFISAVLTPILWILMEVFQAVFRTIADYVLEKIDIVQEILNEFVEFIKNVFTGNWEGAWDNIKNIFTGIMDLLPGFVRDIIDDIKLVLDSLIDFITNVFSGNWSGAWQSMLDILSGIWSGIVGIFKAPLNAIVDGWNSLVGSIGSIKVPDWVPVIGGGSFSLPRLPRLKIGMDYVPSDFYPAFLDEGEAVLTKEENRLYRDLGGLQGMYNLAELKDVQQEPMVFPNFDYKRMGEETAKSLEGMGVYLDKKPVGKIIAPEIDDNLGKIGRRRT